MLNASTRNLPATVEATRAAIDTLKTEIDTALDQRHNHGDMRTRAFGRRELAAIHRMALRVERLGALERHLNVLERAAARPAPPPQPTAEQLAGIRPGDYVKGPKGWELVARVNRTTVTAEVPPGWTAPRIRFEDILAIRTGPVPGT